ncbi:ribosomal protein L14-domain-containing protein [Neohortaea acidophila]|uniref:Ribosomal protein L14-domain-containing protein n=1 Tax=Neohortaea acidophila TaxID=245834 RepID=A0A6A6PIN8_9PEZI|nr:ribosomal protein L14-domain-containing protein [Neohortaea acidophila]KAF2479656.1 ribosomal protein L14-domain-containing protein [Neohortaea acidophila]
MGDADVTASSWKLVEVGRVALLSAGPHAGKIAAIVQIIDHKRVLIDGTSEKPEESVPRHAANLSYMSLTGIVIPKLPRGIGSGALRKKWIEHEVESQWNNSSFAKSRAKSIRRKELSDFERFKVMKLRKQARFEVRKTLAAAKASS